MASIKRPVPLQTHYATAYRDPSIRSCYDRPREVGGYAIVGDVRTNHAVTAR